MWEVWNKHTPINGMSAEHYLERNPDQAKEETIFIRYADGRAVQVEGKNILASVYGIDPTLDNDAFIAAYEKAIEPVEEPVEPIEDV